MLIALGLLFALFVLAFGLLLTIVLVAWSLLRGKRPRVMRFRVDPRSPFSGVRRTSDAQEDVVDIEAREVPDAKSRLPHE